MWARRSDGHLVSLFARDPAALTGAIWKDRTGALAASTFVHEKGVDAVSWYNASSQWEEHAAHVGADGAVYDWRLLDGVAVGAPYKRWVIPGETLTGQVAITRRLQRVFVFVTTVSGKLFAFEITNWAGGNALLSQVATGLSTTSMIAAGSSSTASYVRVFVSKPDNTIGAYLYNGVLPWQSASLSAPPGPGAASCGLLATGEGQVTAQSYHTYLFCTRTGSDHDRILYYRRAVGAGGMAFQGWGITTMPVAAVGTVATSGYGLTARRRTWNGATAVEAYLLNGTLPHSSMQIETEGVALGGMTDLGWDGETTAPAGGVVSGGPENNSQPFLLGSAHDATWLYHKLSNNPGAVQDEWLNHGPAEPWKNYATATGATESSTALLGGRVIHAAIYNSLQRVRVLWSTDDGENWTGPTTIPLPAGYSNMWDPVVDFDHTGKAYIIGLCHDLTVPKNNGVFLWTTTNGTNFTMVGGGPLESLPGDQYLDHPWIQVYRSPVPGIADEVHVTWVDEAGIRYNHVPSTQIGTIGQNIQTIAPSGSAPNIPKLTVSPVDGSAWIVWAQGICRDPTNGTCHPFVNLNGTLYEPSTVRDEVGLDPPGIEIPGTPEGGDNDGHLQWFRVVQNFSVAASSRIANRVYYAFQRSEDAQDTLPFDVRFAVFSYDPANGNITLGQDFVADGQPNTTEAAPELTVTRDAPSQDSDVIFLSYYDWGHDTCTISGVVYSPGLGTERCYRVSEMISMDHGVTFMGEQVLPIASPNVPSDPAHFPLIVPGGDPDHLFLGDYHAVRGELLHSAHTAVTAPVEPNGPSQQLVNVDRGWVSLGYWNNTN